MSQTRTRIAIADDHAFIRMAIAAELDRMPGVELIGEASDSTGLIKLLQSRPCDVLITDYAMPGGDDGDGMQLLERLHSTWPELRVIVMTGLDQTSMIQALYAAGATRILSKSDDVSHVQAAVQSAISNRRYLSPSILPLLPARRARAASLATLSPRELQVVRLILQGRSVNEIAEQLGRRKQTISTQKTSAMQKLGAGNDADLFRISAELGLDAEDTPAAD